MDELSEKYKIKKGTIQRYANRKNWVMGYRLIPKAQHHALMTGAARGVKRVAEEWAAKAEKHREMVFDLSTKSLAKMKVRAPRGFREAEAADKMARRAAGLDAGDVVQQTLININEAIDAFDEPKPAVEVQGVRELNSPSSGLVVDTEPSPLTRPKDTEDTSGDSD